MIPKNTEPEINSHVALIILTTSVQKQNDIPSHSILTKIKTAKGNLISNMMTNPPKKAYFIRGVSKISDYFGQQCPQVFIKSMTSGQWKLHPSDSTP
jgi:hypothetical protein